MKMPPLKKSGFEIKSVWPAVWKQAHIHRDRAPQIRKKNIFPVSRLRINPFSDLEKRVMLCFMSVVSDAPLVQIISL